MGLNFKIRYIAVFIIIFVVVLGGIISILNRPKRIASQQKTLLTVSQEIKALKTPFSPTMSPEGFKAQQTDVERLVVDINQSLEKNDITAAQTSLLQLKERIKQIGDGSKRAIIPEDERKKHDPTGKYLKPFDNPDPATKEWFLDTIDILVALDKK